MSGDGRFLTCGAGLVGGLAGYDIAGLRAGINGALAWPYEHGLCRFTGRVVLTRRRHSHRKWPAHVDSSGYAGAAGCPRGQLCGAERKTQSAHRRNDGTCPDHQLQGCDRSYDHAANLSQLGGVAPDQATQQSRRRDCVFSPQTHVFAIMPVQPGWLWCTCLSGGHAENAGQADLGRIATTRPARPSENQPYPSTLLRAEASFRLFPTERQVRAIPCRASERSLPLWTSPSHSFPLTSHIQTSDQRMCWCCATDNDPVEVRLVLP